MEHFKLYTKKLIRYADSYRQIKILQDINKLFLTRYMLEIGPNFHLYPIEVEAYYHHEINFPDTCVHRNILQKKRFGQLYFHRAGKKDNHIFLYDKGGVDVCLSDNNECFLGILIRSAWINNEDTPVCGPGLITRRIVRYIFRDDAISGISGKEVPVIKAFESASFPLAEAADDKRDKNSPVFHSTRVGINPEVHKKYAPYKLRSLIELKEPAHPFKEKEKAIVSYMKENKIEATAENVKQLLGYRSQAVINKLNSTFSDEPV